MYHFDTWIVWGAPQVAVVVKNSLANRKQETRVQTLGWEDTLEKEMATHSSILDWRISWKHYELIQHN